MKKLVTLFALTLSLSAFAQMTPIGTWHTIDDATGKPSGEVTLSAKDNGELVGVIVKSLVPPKPGDEPNCTQCTDDRKDKLKRGMEIIRGAKQTAGTQMWEGGNILDPNNGKIYKLRMVPLDGGAKLQVRGFIGPFYRTQIWNRVN
jgi:uncharacterized protein (DUF2147 family)